MHASRTFLSNRQPAFPDAREDPKLWFLPAGGDVKQGASHNHYYCGTNKLHAPRKPSDQSRRSTRSGRGEWPGLAQVVRWIAPTVLRSRVTMRSSPPHAPPIRFGQSLAARANFLAKLSAESGFRPVVRWLCRIQPSVPGRRIYLGFDQSASRDRRPSDPGAQFHSLQNILVSPDPKPHV